MKIQVKGYTYETDEIVVNVGDTVILPTVDWLINAIGPTWEGVVSAIGSDYTGPCTKIIGVKE